MACSDASQGQTSAAGTFPTDAYLTQTTDAGKCRIEVRTSPSQPPTRGTFDIQLTVVDATTGKPMDGLAVTAVPWMPAMGHGTSVTPTVTPAGEGHYVLSNVSMFMPGTWQLRTTITGEANDSVTPQLQIP
jgi:hypothetical protein